MGDPARKDVFRRSEPTTWDPDRAKNMSFPATIPVPTAVDARLAALEARVKALEADNERLRHLGRFRRDDD